MIGVMLVDDHAVVVEGLSMLLEGHDGMETVATALSGDDAVRGFELNRPDVTLMDLSMPGMSGVEAITAIRQIDDDARVIALTSSLERSLVTEALAAGASGYLLKSVSGDELADAIRAVAAGQSILTSEVLEIITSGEPAPPVGDDLTPREIEVLSLVAEGLANKQIALALGLTEGTVRIHVSNLLSKLQAPNRTAAAMTAHRYGLVPDAN